MTVSVEVWIAATMRIFSPACTLDGATLGGEMGLKEKTVELNLTSEVIMVLHAISGKKVSVWGPTPYQEATRGFDAKVQGAGFKLLIQYKSVDRFHQGNNEWRFKINDTAAADQHKRLCDHANAGIPTYYALPLFDRYKVIRQNMQTLNLLHLPLVLWIDPRNLNVPNNGVGAHQVGVLAVPPFTATVHSDPFTSEYDPNDFVKAITEIARVERERPVIVRGDGSEPPDPPDEEEGGDGRGEGWGSGLVGFWIG
jgi:hypothetical protein